MADADRPIEGYPPADHLLRDLAIVFERDGDERRMRVELVPEMLNDRGHLDAGVAAVLVDVQSGGAAVEAVQPDWIVTSDMTLHMARPVAAGGLVGQTTLLRGGKNNVVLETLLRAEGEGEPAVTSQLGFTRIVPRESTPGVAAAPPARSAFALPDSGFDEPVYDKLGLRALDAACGRLELDLIDYLRNSVGAMQGGVVVALATRSAQAIARAVLGAPVVTTDATVHYLALVRPGPLRSQASIVRSDGDAAVVRIELRDVGQGDRLCSIATATARRFG